MKLKKYTLLEAMTLMKRGIRMSLSEGFLHQTGYFFTYKNGRLREHNASSSKATRSRLPLKLVYYEAYLSEKDAKDREFKLKRFAGSYIHLKHRIRNSLILSK